MEIEEFSQIGTDLFGNSWQTRMARALGVDGSSVRRWLSGKVAVPPAVEAYLHTMQQRQAARGAQLFLAYPIGEPAQIEAKAPKNMGRMRKRLKFPGVDQLKPMPCIMAAEGPHGAFVTMGDEGMDQIRVEDISFEIVRHPDSSHLLGYAATAERLRHKLVTQHLRHHHYSLIAYIGEGAASIRHIIATHAGNVRLVTASAEMPEEITESLLEQIIGADDRLIGEPEA